MYLFPLESFNEISEGKKKKKKRTRPRGDLNPQSSDSKSDALTIGPRGLSCTQLGIVAFYPKEQLELKMCLRYFTNVG